MQGTVPNGFCLKRACHTRIYLRASRREVEACYIITNAKIYEEP